MHLMRAIIVADGTAPTRAALDAAWPGWDAPCDLVVGADGGAATAVALGLRPGLVVGDADSLDPSDLARLRDAGVPVELSPADKDETDTELAIAAAIRRGATAVAIVGALGGDRVDHALANVALLAHPAWSGVELSIVDPSARIRLAAAPAPDGGPLHLDLAGRIGDLVSLVPLGQDAEGVTTAGLRYPLADETLPFGPARGVSNVRTAGRASVSLRRGRLLVVESPAPVAPPQVPSPGGAR
jgi:thiamine pyrophosphokinase